jgi:hypothetical protein
MRSNRRSKLWGPTKHHFTNNQIDWKVYSDTLWKAFRYTSFTHTNTHTPSTHHTYNLYFRPHFNSSLIPYPIYYMP